MESNFLTDTDRTWQARHLWNQTFYEDGWDFGGGENRGHLPTGDTLELLPMGCPRCPAKVRGISFGI